MKLKKILKNKASQSAESPYIRYILILTLVLLLGFALLYVYNVQKTIKEKFEGQYRIT